MSKGKEKVSQAEFARRIKLSRTAVFKMVKKGLIDLDDQKKIDYEKAISAWEASKNVTRENSRVKSNMYKDDYDPEYGNISDIDNRKRDLMLEAQKSQLVKTTIEAMTKELEYRKMKGELVEVSEVVETNRIIAASIRAKLLTLGSKLAPDVEGLKASAIKKKIEAEVNNILSELNRMQELEEKLQSA